MVLFGGLALLHLYSLGGAVVDRDWANVAWHSAWCGTFMALCLSSIMDLSRIIGRDDA